MEEAAERPVGPTESLCDRLKAARAKIFPTAADAARALGINPLTVRAHERGQNSVGYEDLRKYATVYGVSVETLLYGDGPAQDVSAAFQEMAARAVKAEGQLAYIRDGLRRLLEGLS